ncbi:MAG: PhzF family phenazine biosynthesis protein, partial [Anaerovoracaceae bacterium]
MRFYIVHAFAEEVFGGNPAGVVLTEDPLSPEQMQKIAAELRYSETVFVRLLEDKSVHLRYFTPTAEVSLCGHGTIAAFLVLLEESRIPKDSDYLARTGSGDLLVKSQGRFIMMETAAPRQLATIKDKETLDHLYGLMGIAYQDVILMESCQSYTRLLPLVISTGLPDILLPVPSREILAAINPDYSALAKFSAEHKVTGVHAFTLDRESREITAHCRNFAPLYGIDEEAATGTANSALTQYLYQY